MLRALFYLGVLVVVCSSGSTSKPSEEHSSVWGVELRPKSIGRVKYEDGEVILFSNRETPSDIYFTPFPRIDPSNSECHENVLSDAVELSLSVELYTPQLIAAIHTYLKQRLPALCNENQMCDVSLLPINVIRLVRKGNRVNPNRQLYTLNDKWYSYAAVLQSMDFPISVANESACEHLLSSIVKRCHLSNFELQYSPHSAKTIERTIDIATEQIESTPMFHRIRLHLPTVNILALTSDNFQQLISEVIKRLLLKLRGEQGADSSFKDPLTLDRSLKQQLEYKQIRLTNVNDPLWKSLYWTRHLTRPDQLAKAMNRIIRKSTTDENHFLYDSQTVKKTDELHLSQSDIDRLEKLDEQLTRDAQQHASSQSVEQHSEDEEGWKEYDSLTFDADGSKTRDQSQQIGSSEKVTDLRDEQRSDHQRWNVINVETDNGTRYTLARVDVERYLKELSDHVHLDEDIVVVKPIDIHLIKLNTLRTRTKLLSHTALVHSRSDVHALSLRCPSKNTTTHTLTPTSNQSMESHASTSTLHNNGTIVMGSSLKSENGTYSAIMQGDGNFVLYKAPCGKPLWNTDTTNKGKSPYHLIMQEDGNLVVYDGHNTPTWASNTKGKGAKPYRLVMQDDGNLVVYDANNQPTWARNTDC